MYHKIRNYNIPHEANEVCSVQLCTLNGFYLVLHGNTWGDVLNMGDVVITIFMVYFLN